LKLSDAQRKAMWVRLKKDYNIKTPSDTVLKVLIRNKDDNVDGFANVQADNYLKRLDFDQMKNVAMYSDVETDGKDKDELADEIKDVMIDDIADTIKHNYSLPSR